MFRFLILYLSLKTWMPFKKLLFHITFFCQKICNYRNLTYFCDIKVP